MTEPDHRPDPAAEADFDVNKTGYADVYAHSALAALCQIYTACWALLALAQQPLDQPVDLGQFRGAVLTFIHANKGLGPARLAAEEAASKLDHSEPVRGVAEPLRAMETLGPPTYNLFAQLGPMFPHRPPFDVAFPDGLPAGWTEADYDAVFAGDPSLTRTEPA